MATTKKQRALLKACWQALSRMALAGRLKRERRAWRGLLRQLEQCGSWRDAPSAQLDDRAPSARLVPPAARAAPTQPEQLGRWPWPRSAASGRPTVGVLRFRPPGV